MIDSPEHVLHTAARLERPGDGGHEVQPD
jgi:hypothetical protein